MIHYNNLHTICYLVLLRAKIAVRFLKELGLIRSVLVCALFFMILFQVLAEEYAALLLTAFGLIVISGIHFNRSDQHFIRLIGISKKRLFIIEYLLLSLPMLLFIGYLGAWLWMMILITGCAVIPLISVRSNKNIRTTNALQLPRSLPYEWASGLRSQKWVVVVLLLTGLAGTALHLFAGWIFLFLLTVAIVPFYKYCEPIQFILSEQKSPFGYISQKMIEGIGYYSLLSGILWIEIMILYPGEAVYSLLFLSANLLLLAVVIAGKYAFYRENMNIELMTSIIFGIGCICLLVPYLPPVLVLLSIWLWVRGIKRLKWEVYAFH